jgi:hypothetical protein
MRRLLAASVLGLGLVLFAPPYDGAIAEHATLVGAVTLNGNAAPANVQIDARSTEGIDCGTSTTDEDGSYQLVVSEECEQGSSVLLVLTVTGEQAPTAVTIEGGEQSVSLAFEGLSDASLQAIGAATPTPPPVVQLPSAPLSGFDLWFVVGLAVVPAMILLGLMVRGSSRGKGAPSKGIASNYRSQIEGMVLVMVVLAVILLGVTDKIGSDGLVSVLAAIVGYTIGRMPTRREEEGEEKKELKPPPPKPGEGEEEELKPPPPKPGEGEEEELKPPPPKPGEGEEEEPEPPPPKPGEEEEEEEEPEPPPPKPGEEEEPTPSGR